MQIWLSFYHFVSIKKVHLSGWSAQGEHIDG